MYSLVYIRRQIAIKPSLAIEHFQDKAIIIIIIIVIIRKVSAEHYLGLRDRLQLWKNTLATVAKLGYAFIWQVIVIVIVIFLPSFPSHPDHCRRP